MNAINLLPPDLRRGAGAPGRSGAGVYVVLGALGLAVVLVAVWALMGARVADREDALARAEAEAANAEQRAAAIAHYKQLAADTSARVDGVRSVARGRVDWAATLTEISETVGTEVAFASLGASSAPGAGGGGGANPLRAALPAPAVEIVGCARDHAAVARLIARFRAMEDVRRVSLASSESDDDVDAGQGGGGDDDCRAEGRLPARFNVVIFLEGGPVAATDQTTAAAAPAAGDEDGGTR